MELSLDKLNSVWVLLALMVASLACARADVVFAPKVSVIRNPAQSSATSLPVVSPTATEANIGIGSATATPSRPTPVASPTLPPTPTLSANSTLENVLYESQPGDIVRMLAIRFGVLPSDIRPASGVLSPEGGLVDPGTVLIIPDRLENTGPDVQLIPDSEVVYSPHAAEFDVASFVATQGGYLNSYGELVNGIPRSGAEIVEMVALSHSINPRLLLAILEYYSGWVTNPETPFGEALNYPIGTIDLLYQGLNRQLTWLANELGQGYYGWRAATLLNLVLFDGTSVRLAPSLNAGTVALQYLFSLRESFAGWIESVEPEGFVSTYKSLFGDPDGYFHPLYEPDLEQPPMTLPFLPGRSWSFTGGPHGAWEKEAAWAALDFAPPSSEPGCVPSEEWVVAASPGLVVRSANGLVVVDLDGDGLEQTGWVIMYLHIGTTDRVAPGIFLEQGDLIGHPSCEGGFATGTHLHVVRKYNGEWILADGPLAFNLSGWLAQAGILPYQGALNKGDQTVLACTCSSVETLISR